MHAGSSELLLEQQMKEGANSFLTAGATSTALQGIESSKKMGKCVCMELGGRGSIGAEKG